MKANKFFFVTKGSRIVLKNQAYRYAYAFFSLERPARYLYEYAYQEEECWCTRKEEYSSTGFLSESIVFSEEKLPPEGAGYIRLCVRRAEDGNDTIKWDALPDWPEEVLEVRDGITEADFLKQKERAFLEREDVKAEIAGTVQRIQEKRTRDTLVFTLLSDSHYVVNGNWETCGATIEAVNRQVRPDGIIHLGDLTDGILDKEICREYSRRILDRIRGWGLPFYLTIGNHDANYFRNNPEILSEQEQYAYYLKDVVNGEGVEGQLWYRADFPEHRLRFLFLHAYDNQETVRYGFSQEELEWVKAELAALPEGYRVIIFSHDAPLARLDYWASEIRNGEALTDLLDEWNSTHENRLLAFVHGHTHADYIDRRRTFPIISVGCSKIEYFEDKKPEGALAPVRIEGEVSQELWDTMLVNTRTGLLDFVRFGAGIDRRGDFEKKTKIWAHRGASGYAPENTLEAFALAAQLGADGVELDVQFTKDRELVVIHDERIDRVSDGSGYVADYTLEELRRFCFSKTVPQSPPAKIPTLREVLELLRPTGLTVNIELKTGICFYPGIEKAVLGLVQELEMEERVIYSSFHHSSVLKIKELSRTARTGFLFCDGTLDMAEYAGRYGVTALHPVRYYMKSPGFVKACKERGLLLHVWTINEKAEMEQMVQLGVDAIITNYPDVAYEVIHGRPVPGAKEQDAAMQNGNTSLDDASAEAEVETESAEPECAGAEGKKPALLHLLGVGYGRVRRVFVAIDRVVQRAAGKNRRL